VSVRSVSHYHLPEDGKSEYYTYTFHLYGEDEILYESTYHYSLSFINEMSTYISDYRKRANLSSTTTPDPSLIRPYILPDSFSSNGYI
jgi:hypothetical protein